VICVADAPRIIFAKDGRFELENLNAAISDYVARSAALVEVFNALDTTKPLRVLGSGW